MRGLDLGLTVVAETFRRRANFGVMSYITALVAGTARERHFHGCLGESDQAFGQYSASIAS